jgi:ADP-ribose pyrophosphatase YjhB (NUDIX family)
MKLHYYQKELLKKLTLSKEPLKFNELLLKGLESEHMNYHLKNLISLKLVKKIDNGYQLTNKGKDYTDSLEDDIKTEEKQPKTSVIVRAIRFENGEEEQLLCKRLRHPYYGKVGRITGKVKFGEKLEDAVKRELYEETGLTVEDTKLLKIYRKIRNDDHGNPVQDVMFYIFEVKNPTGTMIEESEFQQNFWVNENDCKNRDDLYEDFKWGDSNIDEPLTIRESIKIASGY